MLDEPTNHLDMRTKDILKNALADFTGTLILVSHDREFLEGLADKVYEFKEHKITRYDGSINDFLKKKKIDSLRQLEIPKNDTASKNEKKLTMENKEFYLEKKEFYKCLRKITNNISICENAIGRLENELQDLSKQLESPVISNEDPSAQSIFTIYGLQKTELDLKMHEWEKLNTELNELRKKQ